MSEHVFTFLPEEGATWHVNICIFWLKEKTVVWKYKRQLLSFVTGHVLRCKIGNILN